MRRLSHGILLSAYLCVGPIHASFYDKKAEGWHWYEQPSILQEPSKAETKVAPKSVMVPTPTQRIKMLQKTLEQKLHLAIMEPTTENVSNYMRAQQRVMDISERFSKSWQKALFLTPALDETLKNPVNQQARQIFLQDKRQQLDKKIQHLSQEYGLLFFFKQSCPYCHEFSKIVKRFSTQYHWPVLAVSLDGGSLPEFPGAKADNGMSQALGIKALPALIAVNPKEEKFIPVAFGMLSIDEMRRRIDILTQGVNS